MKLINQSFEIIEQKENLEGIYKQIEIAGRTCYKSEDRITEDSAKEFVDRMVKYGHTAMLEHGTVYLKAKFGETGTRYSKNKYSKYLSDSNYEYITTNYRVIIENKWNDDLKYICEPTIYHEKRITVRFITDQGILREFTRHRVFSFAVESTRYCNYSKSKFGVSITYIKPVWYNIDKDSEYKDIVSANVFENTLLECEKSYMTLIKLGMKPQDARNILPLATKCEMIMTGFTSDWKHFFDLRDAATAHPQAHELAYALHKEFYNRGLVEG